MKLRDYLNSIPSERRQEARRAFEELDEPEGSIDDLFEQAAYERSAALDPNGERLSRVVVRLIGEETAGASLDDSTAEQVIGAFGREVRAAAGDGAPDARLRLVGFSAGSVVFHFEPARPEIEQGADGAISVWSAADHAIETVLSLHKAIESKLSAQEIQSRFSQPGLLIAARRFLDTLDKQSLDISTRWYSPTGEVSSASVTVAGRRYALDTLFAKEPESESEYVSGHVIVLDADGYVTIKSGHRKPRIRVPVDLVTDGSFVIGQFVQINATKTYQTDKVGITGSESYEFVGFFDGGDIPLFPSADQ
ncbi:hypothetical protein G3T36_02165 [Diaminobutyricibacter tongyongensis]|uniref:Uncharacterized protein n=1 Tax=Leifsonia tongyongensis TaxID=1268043 RepID=A0A6L9XTR1_9MICO|nr:hypothetical protein [Diaminobutyricibacter tongyongensis]NEN04665.1 hypothetical protein [Diaminobutyricibacter tongyongensis]